jgi:hypothetical protein
MLWNTSTIKGYAIEASDGRLGTVSDFLFDDATWLIRWLVVDTGTWLSGRKVLLPPSVLGHVDMVREKFPIRSTKQEIKDSPNIDTDRPVSRQMESHVYDYYGWNPYWNNGLYMGAYSHGLGYIGGMMPPPISKSTRGDERMAHARHEHDDPHLRSVTAVTGYHIHALDGAIGHVEDFLVEDADWSIHYVIVDTKNWWPGKKVLISPWSTKDIEWSNRLVNLSVGRQKIKDSPAYDRATTIDRTYERQYQKYYGSILPSDPL